MKRSQLLLFFIFSSLISFGQANINKAWDLLLRENKRTQAASILNDAANSPTDGPAALLTLAMIEAGNEHYEQSFNYLQRFLAKSDNPYLYIYAFWTYGAFNAKSSGKSMLKYIDE